jgi:hypothetical protein
MIWLGVGLLFSLLLGVAIWASIKSISTFYENGTFLWTADKRVAWSLIHPGWWLLPMIPYWGQKWLNKILDEGNNSLKLPFEKPDRSGSDVVDLKGGDCVLVSEYFERGSGLAHGVRLIPVHGNSILKSGFEQITDLQFNEIPVYSARPIKRVWAVFERSGDTFELRARSNDYVISIMTADSKRAQLCSSYQGVRLNSGDRFIIDITEFQFLKLPHLALVDAAGEIICRDIEIGCSSESGSYPSFEFVGGKLARPVSDDVFYVSVKDDQSDFEPLGCDFLLQPGDRLRMNDDQHLYVSYTNRDG